MTAPSAPDQNDLDPVEACWRSLTRGIDMPAGEREWFGAQVASCAVPKGELLIAEGELVEHAFFLLEGMVRHVSKRGDRQVTFGFDYEGRLTSDLLGFFGGERARSSLEAIEDVTAVRIGRATLEAGYARDPVWEHLGRRRLQETVVHLADKEDRIRTLTPEQRYRALVDARSPLALRVPQYLLAAYLGITPETLSRIRGRS